MHNDRRKSFNPSPAEEEKQTKNYCYITTEQRNSPSPPQFKQMGNTLASLFRDLFKVMKADLLYTRHRFYFILFYKYERNSPSNPGVSID